MTTRKLLAIIIAISLIIGCCLCLTSCSSSNSVEYFEKEEGKEDNGGLVCISRQKLIEGYAFNQYILYDPETYVMYSMIFGSEGAAITVLYNADGTPKLYNPEN